MQLKSRERESNIIKKFVKNYLEDKQSGTMCISGVPGSGKTYTVLESLKGTEYYYINCNNIKQKKMIYKKIESELTCSSKKTSKCDLASLNKHLKDCKKSHIVILDEIDLLITRSQNFLYSLYSLPYYKENSLLLITISNSFSLNLDTKILSRIGENKLYFEPYKSHQLIEIMEYHVEKGTDKNDNIDDNSLTAKNLISRRIGAISGDARKAIDLYKTCKSLNVYDTDLIMKEKSNSLLHQFLPILNNYQKLFLFCHFKKKSINEAFDDFSSICNVKDMKELDFIEFDTLVKGLEEIRLVKYNKKYLSMVYSKEEIDLALQNDNFYSKLRI